MRPQHCRKTCTTAAGVYREGRSGRIPSCWVSDVLTLAFVLLEPCDGKLSCTVPRGLGAGDRVWLPYQVGWAVFSPHVEPRPSRRRSKVMSCVTVSLPFAVPASWALHKFVRHGCGCVSTHTVPSRGHCVAPLHPCTSFHVDHLLVQPLERNQQGGRRSCVAPPVQLVQFQAQVEPKPRKSGDFHDREGRNAARRMIPVTD